MSPDKDESKASGQSASSREADKSSSSPGSRPGPTAVRGDQAPPGTSRSESEASRAKEEPKASGAKGGSVTRDLPKGFTPEPTVGLAGLKRRAAVSLDPIDPRKNVLVYSALEDADTGVKVAVEQEALSTSEVESRRQKLDSPAQNPE